MLSPKGSRAVNVQVVLRPGESADKLIKRFVKKCKKQDILKEHLEKVSFFRTNSQKRRSKRAKNKRLKENLEKKYGSKQ